MLFIDDDRIVFFAGTLYILFSTLVLYGLIRYFANHEIVKGEEISKRCRQFFHDWKYFTCFLLLTGELIWTSLFALIELQKFPMPNLVSKILTTGIHVPFVFLVSGLIIRAFQKPILQKWKITENDIDESIFTITVFVDILLFAFNWEMSLFIMAILLGKSIWLDSTSKDIDRYIFKYFKSFKYLVHFSILYYVKMKFALYPEIGELVVAAISSLSKTICDNEEESDVADMIGLSMVTTLITMLILMIVYVIFDALVFK